MDTLAALAFGGEPALKRFMKEKPKKRDENIVSGYMWSSILTGALLTFGISIFFLLPVLLESFSINIFREGESENKNIYLLTGYFAFFVFISVFNAFNARTDQINLFDNIFKNRGFLSIITLIVVVQILLVYLGREILRCYGLNLKEWLFILGLAIMIIPIDIVRKIIARGLSKQKN
jgi:magnesium-transporting ATPase (P-type)